MRPFICFMLALCWVVPACADEENVKKTIEERIPGIVVDQVQRTPFFGLYEVRAGADILYTDDQVNHFMVGNVVDARTLENLTAARTRQINAIVFDQLPFNQAIPIVRGKGTRKMAYFADPLCGYCRKLDRDLAKLEDVTVYVFLYPVLSPESVDLSRAVWCSPTPAIAWSNLMVNGTRPKTTGDCPSEAVDRNRELGKKLKIFGTPGLVFENNVRVDGAIPLAKLEQHLKEAAQLRNKTVAPIK
ncbi:MAG TPA: DsbC family protein [Burkholderiales bacterium]|nr:DsbC family protein [Burkholderiales bacterium]